MHHHEKGDPLKYEYQYINVEWEWGLVDRTMLSHRSIIDQQAAAGWRFVTIVPTTSRGAVPMAADLVFEREAANPPVVDESDETLDEVSPSGGDESYSM